VLEEAVIVAGDGGGAEVGIGADMGLADMSKVDIEWWAAPADSVENVSWSTSLH
jgi:hypothetical protein